LIATGSGTPPARFPRSSAAAAAGVTPARANANDLGRKSGIGTGRSHETRTEPSQLSSRFLGRSTPTICCAIDAGAGVAIACCGDGTSAA
jgi:hypothetical protein